LEGRYHLKTIKFSGYSSDEWPWLLF
jgi:hypothetical protein